MIHRNRNGLRGGPGDVERRRKGLEGFSVLGPPEVVGLSRRKVVDGEAQGVPFEPFNPEGLSGAEDGGGGEDRAEHEGLRILHGSLVAFLSLPYQPSRMKNDQPFAFHPARR